MKKMPSLVVLAVLASVIATSVFFYRIGKENSAVPISSFAGNPAMNLAAEKGCTACHTIDGAAGIGPTWKGAYGTLRTLSNDSQVVADEAYIRRSILEPAADVVKGFENIMIAPELSESELDQLLQLIRNLGTAETE